MSCFLKPSGFRTVFFCLNLETKKPRRAFSDCLCVGDGRTPLTCIKPTHKTYVIHIINQEKEFCKLLVSKLLIRKFNGFYNIQLLVKMFVTITISLKNGVCDQIRNLYTTMTM